ncbi:mismatch-specific DNA-glycosylase [Metabacillus arenae]|uniref:Mismatch-specific DNA-glycosylase n=1 Tax=Metabacillus arenae TaxID=2771434 RepID=A0A926RWC5_9BACI|nr:mismatch-specific DNA-glycosylase [Metabacillus arenae]MBD1379037.1 mismatch-specific DNA-glycosylase [Metabacillus arenae]
MQNDLDILGYHLDILFIGFNPSIVSGETGHHYANKSNRFWKLLYMANLTDRIYLPEEDRSLLKEGYGFTNIVSRPTKEAAHITPEEYQEGRILLREKLEEYRPMVAFFVGKGVYEQYSKTRKVAWGKQETPVSKNMIEFVAPSSSGLVRMKIEEIVDIYKQVHLYINK